MRKLPGSAWWKALVWPLIRTAVAAVVPFVPSLTSDPASVWLVALLTVAMAEVLTVASGLAGLPDSMGAPWYERALAKGLRQFGQMVLSVGASAILLTDVAWAEVLPVAASSALATVILAALTSLPSEPSLPDDGQTHFR